MTFPIALDVYGDTFRFLAQTDNMHVQVNGQEVAQINQGQFFETVIKNGAQIDADLPILVAEYANSSSFNSSNPGIDPTMIVVPPFE